MFILSSLVGYVHFIFSINGHCVSCLTGTKMMTMMMMMLVAAQTASTHQYRDISPTFPDIRSSNKRELFAETDHHWVGSEVTWQVSRQHECHCFQVKIHFLQLEKVILWTFALNQVPVIINTLAAEPLHANSTGLPYTTFNIITQYADSAHITAPSVCWHVYRVCRNSRVRHL